MPLSWSIQWLPGRAEVARRACEEWQRRVSIEQFDWIIRSGIQVFTLILSKTWLRARASPKLNFFFRFTSTFIFPVQVFFMAHIQENQVLVFSNRIPVRLFYWIDSAITTTQKVQVEEKLTFPSGKRRLRRRRGRLENVGVNFTRVQSLQKLIWRERMTWVFKRALGRVIEEMVKCEIRLPTRI